jgi:hypothetical protein
LIFIRFACFVVVTDFLREFSISGAVFIPLMS